MNYFDLFVQDKLHEECGLVGVYFTPQRSPQVPLFDEEGNVSEQVSGTLQTDSTAAHLAY